MKAANRMMAIIFTIILMAPMLNSFSAVYAAENLEDDNGEITLEDVIAGTATPYEYYGELDESTVPKAIGIDTAIERMHVERLYEEEGDSLNNVVFRNADGTNTIYVFDYPVKYVSESGEIKDITLKITEDDLQSGTYESADNSTKTTLSKSLSDGILLNNSDVSVKLTPVLKNIINTSSGTLSSDDSVAELVGDDTISYVYDDKTTIEYSLTYTGFKEDIVVSEYTGQTEYVFKLETGGLTLIEIDGSYYLTDESGNIKATLGDIIIFTADEKNNTMGSMTHQTIKENEEYLLTIHVDADYLKDDKTVYPIRIDPTIEINYDNNGTGAIEDVTINSLDTSSGSSGSLYIGLRNTYGISRILMRFPALNLSSISSAESITSAKVEIRDLLCESEAMTVYCYVFTGNEWTESTANWSTVKPNNYTAYLSGKSISYASGLNQPIDHTYAFDITNAVKGWKTGNYSQSKGLLFKAPASVEDGSTNIHKTFGSYNRTSYKPSLSVTYSNGLQLIADGTYYINGRQSGDYLKYSSSGATAESGLISSLGSTIRWKIQKVDGGYVIRATSDTTKYLAVPTDTGSSAVEIVSVNNAAIPARCIWSITSAVNGGCLIKSTFNSKYLYTYGTTLYTSTSAGTSGTSQYYSRTWRIVSQSSMSGRELGTGFKIKTCSILSGDTVIPVIVSSPSNALWSGSTEFTYTGYNSNYLTYNSLTGRFTSTSTAPYYCATITATHKVTNRSTTFNLVINPNASLVGVTNVGHDHSSCLVSIQGNITNCGYHSANRFTGSFTVAQINSYLDLYSNNIFVSRSHGGVSTSNGIQVGTSILLNDAEDEASMIRYRSHEMPSSLELSNMDLIMFIACSTGVGGEGGLNLPTVAVSRGGTTAVGFAADIDCNKANAWTKEFFSLMENGYTVQDACIALAEDEAYANTGLAEYVICGNKNLTID